MIAILLIFIIMVIVCAVLGTIIVKKIFGARNIPEKMWTCPVCLGKEKKRYKCTNCGFDERGDFICYRTICTVGEEDVRKRKNVRSVYPGKKVEKTFKWKMIVAACATLAIGIYMSANNRDSEIDEETKQLSGKEASDMKGQMETLSDDEDSEIRPQLNDDELWEEVYNKLIGTLAESEYDFSNLACDSYSEFLLDKGFLFFGKNGNVKEAVPFTTLEKGYNSYVAYTEADSQKANANHASINILEKVDSHDIYVMAFEWNAENWTEDYAKACPLIQNYADFRDIYESLGITEQMLGNCIEKDNSKVYVGKKISVVINLEGMQSITFLLKEGELGDDCTVLIVQESELHNYRLWFK